MTAESSKIIDLLIAQFPAIDFAPGPLMPERCGTGFKPAPQMCVRIPPDRLLEVMEFLRNGQDCRFEQLSDLTCIDYMDFPDSRDRYGVIYTLVSVSLGHRLWAKCFVNDPAPAVPSVTGIWKGADWLEREVFDLFGVRFTGHPDLRRIMTWDGFEGHPLRKDYPLRGRGEREDFEKVARDSA